MALSKDEERTLEEIERALQIDDPAFVATVSFEHYRSHRLIVGGLALLLGMLVLIAGAITTQGQVAIGVIISLAGFLTMVGAVGSMFDQHT